MVEKLAIKGGKPIRKEFLPYAHQCIDEDDIKSVLRQVKSVLKNNGTLVFDLEEKYWLRRIVHFFYRKICQITGFKIYPYSLKRMKKILSEEGFILENYRFFKHRVGRQIVLKCKYNGWSL